MNGSKYILNPQQLGYWFYDLIKLFEYHIYSHDQINIQRERINEEKNCKTVKKGTYFQELFS